MTIEILSHQTQYFNQPQNVTCGNRIYKNITSYDVQDFIDADKEAKTITYMEGADGTYTSIAKDGKEYFAEKQYYKPISKQIGKKHYDNIVLRTIVPGEYKKYTVMSKYGNYNEITVFNNGKIIDKNAQSASNKFLRSTVKSLRKMAAMLFL